MMMDRFLDQFRLACHSTTDWQMKSKRKLGNEIGHIGQGEGVAQLMCHISCVNAKVVIHMAPFLIFIEPVKQC